jgi:hypothetical protein
MTSAIRNTGNQRISPMVIELPKQTQQGAVTNLEHWDKQGWSKVDAVSEQDLQKRYPVPSDVDSAGDFLRDHCLTVISMYKGFDRIRVTLKMTDVSENIEKFEYRADVDIADKEEWNEVFISAARKAHSRLIEIEREKF